MQGVQVNLRFPRFEFRTNAFLSGALAELGMPLAFSEAADFSGMTSAERLFIQEVIQEAFISVDEEGTEAAAATAVIAGATSAPIDIVDLTVDRPFIYLLRDIETGAIPFMGRVIDPTE
jgi:serpin B